MASRNKESRFCRGALFEPLYEAFKLKLKLPLAYEHFLAQYMVPLVIRSRNFPTIALLVDGGDPIRPTYAMSGIPRILERRRARTVKSAVCAAPTSPSPILKCDATRSS
jgi:hypothetical protein